jgi:predicted PurR-regulated permease PerM
LLVATFLRGVVATSADRVGLSYAEHLANGCYYVFALLTFIAAFIPFAGAIVAGAAAVLIAFVSGGLTDALLVLAAVIIVQQAESHLLQPLIMGRTLNLHPVVVVLSVTAGTLLAGVAGAVIAVPIVAVVYRVASVLAAGDVSASPPAAGDASASPPAADP